MKNAILLLLICATTVSFAQKAEEDAVRMAIDNFFIGFHQKDRVIMENAVSKDVVMQTIGKNREGKIIVKTEVYDDFINSIIAIPEESTYEEKLLDYTVQVDGDMAHVWTPYEFWYNKEFSHCGVNSIQLVKLDGKWKIVYLIDTRRKENCVKE